MHVWRVGEEGAPKLTNSQMLRFQYLAIQLFEDARFDSTHEKAICEQVFDFHVLPENEQFGDEAVLLMYTALGKAPLN